MINEFKSLVDSIDATIFNDEDFEKEYGINLDDKSIDFPKDKFIQELNNIFDDITDGLERPVIGKISREFVYRQVIYNEDSIPYLQIIKIIFDCVNPDKFPYFDDVNWKTIVKLCKNILNFHYPLILSENNLKEVYNKDFNRATSIKFLLSKNSKIEISNGDVKFISGLENIFRELDNKIDEFGGINLIFECISHFNYNQTFDRYFFIRDLSYNNKDIAIPWGYILNLSLKHLHFKHISKRTKYEKLFKEILNLASVIINGVYNIQEYNIWHYIFLDRRNIPKDFSSLVLYDSLFTISQSNFNLELDLCKFIFSQDDDFFKEQLGFSIDDYILVFENFIDSWKNENKPVLIFLSKKKHYILPYNIYSKVLNFMAHSENLNENYLEPNDYLSIDFFEKPLIKYDNNSFLLPSLPWSAPNFYESLVSPLRSFYENELSKDLDEILGERLEMFIAEMLEKSGVSFIKGGQYKFRKNPAECDFIIESDKSIIIIEVKKKVLTRNSKSGRDYSIFFDLSNSLLYSQIQAGKVELLLKENGKILLDSNNSQYTVFLKDKIIKRISLTQFEYGALHNQIFVEKFFESLLNGDYVLKNGDEDLNKKFDKFIKHSERFRNQYIQLNKIKEENFRFFVSRCYFMSLSQLYEVLKRSTGNNSFDANLPNNQIHNESLDWYCEYGQFNVGGV